jgi:hypothetical protein
MSPHYFYIDFASGFTFYSNAAVHSSYGLRPAISIKPGQLITKGTGTAQDPYVIG